ncbi:hypothetical protein DXA13_10420 [Clostridium sp. AM58-1XD]|nr:hypothetical protein DXA13_10420 [Clostridium sp. AM58-1XD]
MIDPPTATGWVKNDSGHWLYYKGGTAFTGWREVDGKWYLVLLRRERRYGCEYHHRRLYHWPGRGVE